MMTIPNKSSNSPRLCVVFLYVRIGKRLGNPSHLKSIRLPCPIFFSTDECKCLASTKKNLFACRIPRCSYCSIGARVQTSALFILPANICSSLASCNMLIYSAERSMHACKDAVSFFLVLFLSHAAERKQRR